MRLNKEICKQCCVKTRMKQKIGIYGNIKSFSAFDERWENGYLICELRGQYIEISINKLNKWSNEAIFDCPYIVEHMVNQNASVR